MKAYMVRHKVTGKFWNGQVSWSRFDSTGKSWKKKSAIEQQIAFLYRYQSRYKTTTLSDIQKWEIVEVDLTPVVKNSEEIDTLIRHIKIRNELQNVDIAFSSFLAKMREKNVEDDIKFIMDLEPATGSYRVDMKRIKEARAQIRGLGIKTRTFREYRGMFGFTDRQQAMKARLVLNAKKVVDVDQIRKKVDDLN